MFLEEMSHFRAREMAQPSVKCLLYKDEKSEFEPSHTHIKNCGVVTHAYNPRAKEAESRRFLGFGGQTASCTWSVPGH